MRIAVLLIVILAGCASLDPKWTKPGSKPEEFKTDDAQCETQALAASNAINSRDVRNESSAHFASSVATLSSVPLTGAGWFRRHYVLDPEAVHPRSGMP